MIIDIAMKLFIKDRLNFHQGKKHKLIIEIKKLKTNLENATITTTTIHHPIPTTQALLNGSPSLTEQ